MVVTGLNRPARLALQVAPSLSSDVWWLTMPHPARVVQVSTDRMGAVHSRGESIQKGGYGRSLTLQLAARMGGSARFSWAETPNVTGFEPAQGYCGKEDTVLV